MHPRADVGHNWRVTATGEGGDDYLAAEARARKEIDRMLGKAGWVVQDRTSANLGASVGSASRVAGGDLIEITTEGKAVATACSGDWRDSAESCADEVIGPISTETLR